jgi:hypothetical protein
MLAPRRLQMLLLDRDEVQASNYGQSNLAKAFVMSDSNIRDFMAVSQSWHAANGMAPANQHSHDNLRGLWSFEVQEKASMALELARSLVRRCARQPDPLGHPGLTATEAFP